MAVFTQAVIPSNGHAVKPGGHVMPASMAAPVQVPLEQNCPNAQALPHVPQLVGSRDVSTQAVIPPNGHAVKPGGHVTPASMAVPLQVPLEQNCPNEQASPHAPQLVGSMAVFTQAVIPPNGHAVRPGGHVTPASIAVPLQVPLEHNCPNEQASPHAPQLVGSMAVFTQAVIPPNGHAVRPGGHVTPASMAVPVQVPLEHNCPNAQALPHAPQLVGSKAVFTQAVIPSNGHAVRPDGHVTPASMGHDGSDSCDDCVPGVLLLPEHDASANAPTREPTANVA
jgi:hypothetical protein